MGHIPIEDAQKTLPELAKRAAAGEDVLITAGDGDEFKLVPVARTRRKPVFGSARGLIELEPDFDAPIEDFEPYET